MCDFLRTEKNKRICTHTADNVYHINVIRPAFENGLTEEQKNHPSETALDDVTPDYVCLNTGIMDNLKQEVIRIVQLIGVEG